MAVSAPAAPARPKPPFRLSLRGARSSSRSLRCSLVYATDQILPATTDRQAELRFWLAARATGVVTLLLLTAQIVFGLVLSHPHNKTTWKLSKRIFPWHEHLWVFVMAFLVASMSSASSWIPRPVSMSAGPSSRDCRSTAARPSRSGPWRCTPSCVTAITARWTKLLPSGLWLKLHRLLAGDLRVQPGSTGSWPAPIRRRSRALYIAMARGRHRRRRLPLLGAPSGPTHIRHRTHGGRCLMSTKHLVLRRLVTVVGVVAVLALGFGSIRAASAWTAASAPLTVAPVSASRPCRPTSPMNRPAPRP